MFNRRLFVLTINGLVCAELICFAAYSIYVTNISLLNMTTLLSGGLQTIAVAKNKMIRFNITIIVLTLHAFLAFGFFFPIPETHWKPKLTYMESVIMFILTELIFFVLIWMSSKSQQQSKFERLTVSLTLDECK